MTTTAHPQQTVPTWPLARRVVSGFVQPGGRALVTRAIEGAGLDEGSRVVEPAPGPGVTSSLLNSTGPHTWPGVEPDPLPPPVPCWSFSSRIPALLGLVKQRLKTGSIGGVGQRRSAPLLRSRGNSSRKAKQQDGEE